jgi:hypothetical protein
MKELLDGTSLLAMWGAFLSTLLAAVKLWELWRSRLRLDIGYNFTGSEEIGNEIIIRNLSGTPFLITYWELLWRQRTFLHWKQSHLIGPEEDNEDIKVGAHSSIKLTFREQNHFDWGVSALRGRTIFVRLHIAGKSRPVLRKVYG